jgi:uncharacterized membrane protein (UPF0127 family)
MRKYLVGAFAALIFPFLVVIALAQQPMLLPVHPVPLVIETKTGERQIFIEVATRSDEHARGLMFRTEMPDNRGMLFVFPSSSHRSFWMKNTPMPLDLLFIGEDGRVRSIQPGEPFSVAQIAPPVISLFVLELKAGTSARLGIEEGDQLRHPLIQQQ